MDSVSTFRVFAICTLMTVTGQAADNDPVGIETNVVTIYTIKCYEGELIGSECVGGYWLTNHKQNYRVLVEQQIVVSWFPNLSVVAPMKFTDCAIVSSDHWTCRYSDNSGEFGFRKGEYYSESSADRSAEQREKSRRFWGQMTVDKERWLAVQQQGDEAILEHRRRQEN